MKSYVLDHPVGWVALFWNPHLPWRRPRMDRWTQVQCINAGRVSIGFGWHWPPRAPVCG